MKNILESIIVTFGMFTKVPVPNINWNDKNMKYVFVFFPFIGFFIGISEYILYILSLNYEIHGAFYSSIAVILPVVITGGIHIDGFADSCDAICSYGDKEKRLSIMSDPHIGAFGTIYLIVYFLLSFGIWSHMYEMGLNPFIFLIPFTVGRIVGGIIIKTEKPAKNTGLMFIFKNSDEKDLSIIFSIVWIVILMIILFYISFIYMIINSIVVVFYVFVFRRYVYRNFGGFTGDLVGFSITILEILLLFCTCIGGVLSWF